MGTAVLAEKPNVLLDKEIWSSKKDLPKQENILERVAHKLRLKGHDAIAAHEGDGGNKVHEYFERLKLEVKNEKNGEPAIKRG